MYSTPTVIYEYDDQPSFKGELTNVFALVVGSPPYSTIQDYTYDSLNRIKYAAEYYYDGNGNLIKKITTGIAAGLVYDASGRLTAEYSTRPAEMPQVNYLTTDHLGNPWVITNKSGAVLAHHDYHPFGEEIATSQSLIGYHSDEISEKFTGYERDDEIVLDFAQTRYYAKDQGRFTTVDPVNLSNGQKYAQKSRCAVYVWQTILFFGLIRCLLNIDTLVIKVMITDPFFR